MYIEQYAFTVESKSIFEEWDSFLESQVLRAKDTVRKQTILEKAKAGLCHTVVVNHLLTSLLNRNALDP